jgi:translation initiation factor IF-3
MLVIDEDGTKLGILSKKEAQALADEKDLDLVLVSNNSTPAVCKLMNYSKYRYDQQKKIKESKKNQKRIEVKEVQLSAVIQKHDIETRRNQALKHLEAGNKIKIRIFLKGRMLQKMDMAKGVINEFISSLDGIAKIESEMKFEGPNLFVILAPIKSNK